MSKVLVVEDDKAYSGALALHLRKRGHETIVANNISEGVKAAEQEGIQAVVTDLNLPEGSGLSMLRELRQKGMKCFAVVLSAFVENGHLEGWEHLDVFDVISKTNSLENVIKRIEAAIDMSENMAEAMHLLRSLNNHRVEVS